MPERIKSDEQRSLELDAIGKITVAKQRGRLSVFQRLLRMYTAAGSLFLVACGQIPFNYVDDYSPKEGVERTIEQIHVQEIMALIQDKIKNATYRSLLTDPNRTTISWGVPTPSGSGPNKTEKGDILWKISTKPDLENKKNPVDLAFVNVHRDNSGRIIHFLIGIDTQVNRKNGVQSELDQFLDPTLAPDYAGSRLEEVLQALFALPEDTAFQTKSPVQSLAWGRYQTPAGASGVAQVFSYGTASLTENMPTIQTRN